MTMITNETKTVAEALAAAANGGRTEDRVGQLLAVRDEEGELGVEYSRRVLYVDRAISELMLDGVPAERLARVLGLSVALVEERARRHRRLAG